jgi:oligopeptidase A
VLGGAELTGADRERFARIQERQAELAQKFSENALDATDAFSYLATEAELDGVPADVKQTARAAARRKARTGYKLTLKMPCYLPVMQFATQQRPAPGAVPRLRHPRLGPGRRRCRHVSTTVR